MASLPFVVWKQSLMCLSDEWFLEPLRLQATKLHSAIKTPIPIKMIDFSKIYSIRDAEIQ